MKVSFLSSLKKKSSLDCFCVFPESSGPLSGAMPRGLWPTGLLLCFLGVCACLEEDCVLGIVGRPVSLPCFYPQLLTSVNVSIEWRQDDQVVLNATWRDDGDVVKWSINRANISAEALLTGNISLELPSVDHEDNNKNYSVFITSGDNQSAALCSVCLRIAEEDCVLGLVGRPVLLPCFYPQLLTSVNVSIEWRQDDQVVLKATWRDDGDVVEWSINRASVSAEALLTGNISLELPSVDPADNNKNYSVFITSGDNQSAALCSVCLRVAASFSFPLLRREKVAQGNKTFLCQSGGGFPDPAVHWLIDNTAKPPEGSVKTLITSPPDSQLFNITSRLTVNVPKDSSVSCIIENPAMNETLTATTYGADGSPVVSRASEAMWIFSTVLCVVVGVMVIIGVGYQILLDRISKRKKKEYQYQQTHANRGYRRRRPNEEETVAMKTDKKETDV